MWNRLVKISLIFFFVGVIFSLSTIVLAHADLKSARPAPGQAVTESPAEIELIFTEAMQSGNISLYSDANQQIATSLQPSQEEATLTTAIETDLTEGEYRVIWQATSLDGHMISGSYNFAYQQETTASESDNSLYIFIGAMSALLIFSSGFSVMYRRRT